MNEAVATGLPDLVHPDRIRRAKTRYSTSGRFGSEECPPIELELSNGKINQCGPHGKQKGGISFEIPPSTSDFSKIRFGFQIATYCYCGITWESEPVSSRSPCTSTVSIVARDCSVPPRSLQLPECFASSVAGSRGGGRLFSLLLEDLSSVDLKDTRDLAEYK